MVVASGQFPYEYDFSMPVRGPIGQSGNILEAGMFVINAELRKWGVEPQGTFTYNKYVHPDVAGSGFEPKADGSTLGGDVAGPALVAIDNIIVMRDALRDNGNSLFNTYASESWARPTDLGDIYLSESWFTTAYPGHTSGWIDVNNLGGTFERATFQRPELTDITGGDDHLDTDLHWIAGSGIFLDVDVGEVVFQPIPFHRERGQQPVGDNDNPVVTFRPYFPMFQKTNGSIITLTGRERDLGTGGVWGNDINFDAIGSGKVQLDGYAIVPQTELRFISDNRNWSNYFDSISSSSDMTFFERGQRVVNGNINDGTARTYWTPQAQASGFYSIIPVNPKSIGPYIGAESGVFGCFPQIDYRSGLDNRNLDKATISVSSDGIAIKSSNGILSRGYQVFDDSIWITTPGQYKLSGILDLPSRGVLPMSPYNNLFMWYRPAELTAATIGNQPAANTAIVYNAGVDVGTPGNFEVHVGLEEIGTDEVIRLSRVWDQQTSTNVGMGDTYTNIAYFQRYDWPSMDHTEVSETWSWTFPTAGSSIGNFGIELTDFTFDGTFYWVSSTSSDSRKTRFTSALVFDGYYVDPNTIGEFAPRMAFVDSEYLYWHTSHRSSPDATHDALRFDANMTGHSYGSGIGKLSVVSDPADITNSFGALDSISAKPIIAETIVGVADFSSTVIHDIVEVTSAQATHVTPGIWVLIQFQAPSAGSADLWLLRVSEQATHYRVDEAIDTRINMGLYRNTSFFRDTLPEEYPYEIMFRDIN